MKTYDELLALITQRGVHAEFGDAGEGWGIEQNPHELAIFLVHMQKLGVQSALEIGTGYKAGLAHFLAMDMGWSVYSIDVQGYGHKKTVPHETVLFQVVKPGEYIKPYAPLDLVFIDGNHSYENVKADYERWGQYANKVIAFHDIVGLRDCEGVARLWRELAYWQGNLKAPNFMDAIDLTPQKAGIGWIEL